ncbi:MAG: hypothetical protein ACXWU7_02085, partial [Telluria sp.]
MSVCARALLQPDGSYLLALDPTATDLTACTYVVQSGEDLSNSFTMMTAEDGGYFSAGLVTCWMTAYGIKAIIKILKGSSNE